MAKQAKLTLGLDIRPLVERTQEVKRTLESIGDVKLDKSLQRSLRQSLIKDLNAQTKSYKDTIQKLEQEISKLAKAEGDAFDTKKMAAATDQLGRLKREASDVSRIIKNMKFPSPQGMGGMGVQRAGVEPRQQGAPGGALGGLGSLMRGPAGAVLGGLGVGLGVSTALSRATQQAEAGLRVRGFAGSQVGDESRFGFTRMERRDRATDIAQAAGQRLTQEQLDRQVDLSEMLERAFGVTTQQFAGFTGAARRAGVDDQGKFMASAVGDAVAQGLTGSRIGEYLHAMTGYMESVSKGIDVNESSLRGFATSLGSLEFFKQDPERMFDAIRGIEQAFREGNEYQQFLTFRAIQQAQPGIGPAGIEVRRRMPLFGQGDEESLGKLRGMGMGGLADVFDLGGEKMVNARARTVMQDIENARLSEQDAFLAFTEGMGLKPGQALPVFTDLMEQKRGGVPTEKLRVSATQRERMREAGMSPEEIAKKNMETFSGSVKVFSSRVERLKDTFADFTTEGVLKMTDGFDAFSSATGMFRSDIEKLGLLLVGAGGVGAILTRRGGMFGGAATGAAAGSMLGRGGALLLGGATAATLGYEIGSGMRRALNEWTDNGWDRSVQKFWEGASDLIPGLDLFGNKKRAVQDRMRTEDVRKWQQHALETRGSKDLTTEEMVSLQRAKERFEGRDAGGGPMGVGGLGAMRPDYTVEDVFEAADLVPDEEAMPEDMTNGGVVPEYQQGGRVGRRKQVSRSLKSAFGTPDKKPKEKPDPKESWTLAQHITSGLNKLRGKKRAMGGPIGLDTVPAWLTPGEYVVNQRSTAKNLSALVHANEGGLIAPAQPRNVENSMPSMDFSSVEMAMLTNTSAIQQLTNVLLSMATATPQMRSFPRGSGDLRMGHGVY